MQFHNKVSCMLDTDTDTHAFILFYITLYQFANLHVHGKPSLLTVTFIFQIRFTSKLYHHNFGKGGELCPYHLNQRWRPATNMKDGM